MTKDIVRLKNKLMNNEIQGLALDIDETLSFTIGLLVEKLMIGVGNPENLSVREIIDKYRHTDNIPYWRTETADKIIHEVICSNEVQEELPLVENANKVVEQINKIIPIVAYITVRSESIRQGTQAWLNKHNFPKADLIMKPNNIDRLDGNKWKAEVLEYLHPQVVGIVDDNPGLTNFLSESYKGTIFLYDNIESKRKDINIIPCKTWTDVDDAVKKLMS